MRFVDRNGRHNLLKKKKSLSLIITIVVSFVSFSTETKMKIMGANLNCVLKLDGDFHVTDEVRGFFLVCAQA